MSTTDTQVPQELQGIVVPPPPEQRGEQAPSRVSRLLQQARKPNVGKFGIKVMAIGLLSSLAVPLILNPGTYVALPYIVGGYLLNGLLKRNKAQKNQQQTLEQRIDKLEQLLLQLLNERQQPQNQPPKTQDQTAEKPGERPKGQEKDPQQNESSKAPEKQPKGQEKGPEAKSKDLSPEGQQPATPPRPAVPTAIAADQAATTNGKEKKGFFRSALAFIAKIFRRMKELFINKGRGLSSGLSRGFSNGLDRRRTTRRLERRLDDLSGQQDQVTKQAKPAIDPVIGRDAEVVR